MDMVRMGIVNIFNFGDDLYKVYYFELLLKKQRYIHRVMNEYAVARQARVKNLKHVIHLKSLHLGENHIGFLFPRY